MSEGFLDFDIDGLEDPNAAAPAGAYTLSITKAEDKLSKSGRRMLELSCQIVGDEEHAGKFVNEYYVLDGDDYPGRNGRYQVSQLAQAIGIGRGASFEDFVGQQFEAEVSLEPPTENFNRESNKIARIYV